MELFFAFLAQQALLAGAFVVLVVLYFVTEARRGGLAVTPQHLVNLTNRENALVVDLRDGADYRAGHIAGAIHLPLKDVASRLSDLQGRENQPVVLVCKHGQAAGGAGKILRAHGFQQVFRLGGGMHEWENARLPLVKS